MAFKTFTESDEIKCNPSEAKAWVEGLKLPPLPIPETYHYEEHDPDREPKATEYILTEKQSALFLLRFK